MEVDLLERGVDLLDYYRGKLSLRRLVVCALELPIESRLMQEIARREHGDQARWSEEMHVMADIDNGIRQIIYMLQMDNWNRSNRKGREPERPEMIHPPGWKPEKPKMSSVQELKNFFGL